MLIAECYFKNNNKTMKKSTILLAVVAISFFLLGRSSVKQTNEVVYTKGKPVSNTIQVSLPTKEITPIAPLLPYKYVFIDNTKTEVVDTAKIISDYIAEKSYSVTLFDNLHGKLEISPTVQYNKLTTIPYTFTPIEKTVFRKQKWTLFSTVSYNTFNIAGVGGGVYYKNMGMHYKYLWNANLHEKGHEVGFNVIF